VLGSTNRSAALLDQTRRFQEKLTSTNPNLHSTATSSLLFHTLPHLARFQKDETVQADSLMGSSVSLPWNFANTQQVHEQNIRLDTTRLNNLYYRKQDSYERLPSNDLPTGNANTSNMIFMQKKRVNPDRSNTAPIFSGKNVEPFSSELAKQDSLGKQFDETIYPNPIAKTRFGRTMYKKTSDLFSSTTKTEFSTTKQISESPATIRQSVSTRSRAHGHDNEQTPILATTIGAEDLMRQKKLSQLRVDKLQRYQERVRNATEQDNELHHSDRGRRIDGFEKYREARYFHTTTMVL